MGCEPHGPIRCFLPREKCWVHSVCILAKYKLRRHEISSFSIWLLTWRELASSVTLWSTPCELPKKSPADKWTLWFRAWTFSQLRRRRKNSFVKCLARLGGCWRRKAWFCGHSMMEQMLLFYAPAPEAVSLPQSGATI